MHVERGYSAQIAHAIANLGPGNEFEKLLTWLFADNLAVSAQGFRRGANRVRKVSPYRASVIEATTKTNILSPEHVVSIPLHRITRFPNA